MFKNIRTLHKITKDDNKKALENMTLNDDQEVIVPLTLSNESNIISLFSIKENPILDESLSNFIEEQTHFIPIRQKIAFEIQSDEELSDEVKAQFLSSLSKHYHHRSIAIAQEKIINQRNVLIFLLIGVVFLGFAFFVSAFYTNQILSEILMIIGWVFVWEATDLFFIERGILNKKQIKYHRIQTAKVTFKKK